MALTIILTFALIVAIITILALNNKAKKLNEELDKQSKLGAKLSKENISNGAKISALEEENNSLKEENLKVNGIVRKQEKYVNQLEEKNKILQKAYDMLNQDTAELMTERDNLQKKKKKVSEDVEKEAKLSEDTPKAEEKTTKKSTKKTKKKK